MARTMHITESEALQLGLVGASHAAAVAPNSKREKRPSKRNLGQEAFAFQCRAYRLPQPEQQWKLLKSVQVPRADGKAIPNAWRFDFCWPRFKLIVEVDGGTWRPGGGAHSHPIDLERNRIKRNDAALAGYHVIAFPPEDFTGRKREAMEFVIRTLATRGWQP